LDIINTPDMKRKALPEIIDDLTRVNESYLR